MGGVKGSKEGEGGMKEYFYYIAACMIYCCLPDRYVSTLKFAATTQRRSVGGLPPLETAPSLPLSHWSLLLGRFRPRIGRPQRSLLLSHTHSLSCLSLSLSFSAHTSIGDP